MSEVYSMTGYASLRGSVRDTVAFTLAMKSVNHRFLTSIFGCRRIAMASRCRCGGR